MRDFLEKHVEWTFDDAMSVGGAALGAVSDKIPVPTIGESKAAGEAALDAVRLKLVEHMCLDGHDLSPVEIDGVQAVYCRKCGITRRLTLADR